MPYYGRGRRCFWTEARDTELIRRYEGGESYFAIADYFGRTPEAVYRRCCVLGLRDFTHVA